MSHFFQKNYLLLLFLIAILATKDRVQSNIRGVIWSDCEGYFVYLPAAFNLKNFHAVPEGSMNTRKNERGEVVMKYTCGVAYFQLPFFLIARAWNDLNDVPRTEIYHANFSWAVTWTSVIICFLGFFYLKKALEMRGFAPVTVFLTIVGVFAGTNLWHYATKEVGMSHVYSFALFAYFIYFLPKFLAKISWKNAFIMGLILGWISLIRPTNLLLIVLIITYDVYDISALRTRVKLLLNHMTRLTAAAIAALLVWLPQMLYWKTMLGQWMTYSYEGESFIYWKEPKILAVLFDSQNGLFTYSPMVLLPVAALCLFPKKNHAPGMLLMFWGSTYLFASWWAWWFGGAFGHRCYVEWYAFLAFPLAELLKKLLAAPRVIKVPSLLVFVFMIFYSVRMSYLYCIISGPWDGPEWRWNLDKMLHIWAHLFKLG